MISIQKKNFNHELHKLDKLHEFLLATDETQIFTDKGKDSGYKIAKHYPASCIFFNSRV
jgi:hypothetical protein